ncbi:Cysteine protease atg4 [Mycoemilia scoparia]|uniref:Cysteine protease n=1 Tax=Mycoemilia scoparia TaxID=417184 RepID=A0A9W8A6P8_9FUNG|nr:Cysteine protease atg4 [Mycoemilia scoparia]
MGVKLKRRSNNSDSSAASTNSSAGNSNNANNSSNSTSAFRLHQPLLPNSTSLAGNATTTDASAVSKLESMTIASNNNTLQSPSTTSSTSNSNNNNNNSNNTNNADFYKASNNSDAATEISNLRFKVVNTLRQWYMNTTHSMNQLLTGRLLKSPSGQLWLLGVEYSRKPLDATSDSGVVSGSSNANSNRLSESPPAIISINKDVNTGGIRQADGLPLESNSAAPQVDQNGGTVMTKLSSSYPESFLRDFQSLVWCTYRARYPPISPTAFTTDAGWGCMLRAGQSLLGQALLMHNFGRCWRIDKADESQRKTYTKILEQFVDDADPLSSFSIHHMASLGRQYGKDIGEWFGPNATAQIIKQLATKSNQDFHIYTTMDSTVYVMDILESSEVFDIVDPATINDQDSVSKKQQAHKSATSLTMSGSRQPQSAANMSSTNSSPLKSKSKTLNTSAFTSCAIQPTLILASTRLGIDHVNPIYYPFIQACLTFSQSVGIAGGKPSSALYFVGYEDNDLIYLDPHYTRPAIPLKPKGAFETKDFGTYHCDTPRKISISRIDPCMVFGFYCRDSASLLDLCQKFDVLAQNGIQCGFTMNWSHSPANVDDLDVLDDVDMSCNSDDMDSLETTTSSDKVISESESCEAIDYPSISASGQRLKDKARVAENDQSGSASNFKNKYDEDDVILEAKNVEIIIPPEQTFGNTDPATSTPNRNAMDLPESPVNCTPSKTRKSPYRRTDYSPLTKKNQGTPTTPAGNSNHKSPTFLRRKSTTQNLNQDFVEITCIDSQISSNVPVPHHHPLYQQQNQTPSKRPQQRRPSLSTPTLSRTKMMVSTPASARQAQKNHSSSQPPKSPTSPLRESEEWVNV